jgi:hypothetical protein
MMKLAHWLLAGLLLSAFFYGACEPKSLWEGRYVEPPDQGPASAVTLTLQAGGKGQWTADQESTLLRWEERNGDLWLHLKAGGVVVAKTVPSEKALIFELPGGVSLMLRKTSQ